MLETAVIAGKLLVLTVKEEASLVVPIVVAPTLEISNCFVELVDKSSVFAADRYIPFETTVDPLGIKPAAVSFPLHVAAAPLTVPVNVGLADRTTLPLPVDPVHVGAVAALAAPVLVRN